ncbi:MAG: winged helix-turn-helix domain-containing protein [Pseudomonadota bacterium]
MPSFAFGPWVVHPEQNLLTSAEGSSRLEPKAMALLTLLAERSPEVVPTQEILDQVWSGVYVVEGVVYRSIAMLRKALGDNPRRPNYIESVPRVGYRLIQDVSVPAKLTESTLGLLDVFVEDASETSSLQQLALNVSKFMRWGSDAVRVLSSAPRGESAFRLTLTDGVGNQIAWQLVHAPTEELVWSASIERPDQATLASRVDEFIAETALDRLYRHQTKRIAALVVPDSERSYWDLILLSDHFRSTDPAELSQRRHRLLRAIEMFPQLAPAYAAWADYCSWLVLNGLTKNAGETAQTARRAADTAVDLEPDGAYGLRRCGTVYARLGDYEHGIEFCRRSVGLAPSTASREALARVLCFAGVPRESIEIYEDVLYSMPAGQVFQYGKLVPPLIQDGNFASAEEYSRLSVINFPKDFFGWALRSNLLARMGRNDEAVQAWREVLNLRPDLNLDAMIQGTLRTYGRSALQRERLTEGYERLQALL